MDETQGQAPPRLTRHERVVAILDDDGNPLHVFTTGALIGGEVTFEEASNIIGQGVADVWARLNPEWTGAAAVFEDTAASN